jgi:hypothetical protein
MVGGSRPGFLERLAVFYAIRAAAWNYLVVTPAKRNSLGLAAG